MKGRIILLAAAVVILAACSKENNHKSITFKIANVSAVQDCWLQVHEYDASNNPICTNHLAINMNKEGCFLKEFYHANVQTMKITLEISSHQTGGSSMWYPYPIALGTGYYDYNKGKSIGDSSYDVYVSAYDFTGKHDPIWDLN